MNNSSLRMHQNPGMSTGSMWKRWVGVAGLGLLVSAMPVGAAEPPVPWECSEYSGDAQTRCMHTLLELQQEKIAKLEEQLKVQEGTVNELKEKMDRQEAAARLEEKKIYKQDPRWPPTPYTPPVVPSYGPSYGYGYAPAPPIGIYLGSPWRYPRYYGYGPGYWGRPGLSFNFRFGGGGYRHRHR